MANNDGRESVWDYPRPPRIEATSRHLRVVHRGIVLADSTHAMRILETSHPPVYAIPREDLAMDHLAISMRRSSFCEFKGSATYWTAQVEGEVFPDVAWSYEEPSAAYARLRGSLAFYASRVDECWVDGERVEAQAGDFYGGWITSDLKGPFKGAAGTTWW